MSIFLNLDDIRNIDSEETQKKILSAISSYVKEIAITSAVKKIEIDIFPEVDTAPKGIPGKQLLQFAGLIDSNNLQQISEAIEADCEQVNPCIM